MKAVATPKVTKLSLVRDGAICVCVCEQMSTPTPHAHARVNLASTRACLWCVCGLHALAPFAFRFSRPFSRREHCFVHTTESHGHVSPRRTCVWASHTSN